MKILVLGGNGFVGQSLQKRKPNWIYWSRRDCNLLDVEDVRHELHQEMPDAIVNLAAYVGGIKTNIENNLALYEKNLLINMNVLSTANRIGIPRVLTALSTCAWPDKFSFVDNEIFNGAPPVSNSGYAWAKRQAHVHSTLISNQQQDRTYTTFAPSNLYGPNDNFDESGHFVASLIRKVYEAEQEDAKKIELWGTGIAFRQQLYVKDLARIIPRLLEEHVTSEPLLVAPDEYLSINEFARHLIKHVDNDIEISYNGMYEGQKHKFGNPALFQSRFDFDFTPYEIGVAETYDWYIKSRRSDN